MEKIDQALYDDLYLITKTLLSRGTENDMIEKHLLQKTSDSILIAMVMREARKDHYATLRAEGFKLIGIGAALVFLGFFITFLNWESNKPFLLAMYAFTGVGASIVFWGLYKVIG